ncbi:Large ribosomal subunit protein uL10m [Exophiala dermatitidis]
MPPRLRLRSLAQLADLQLQRAGYTYTCGRCQYATAAATATATTPAPTDAQIHSSIPQLSRYSPVQPPSHRSPLYRKSQLLRSYVSILQTTPLIVFFQHNNLKAAEWVGIRRELTSALRKLDEQLSRQGAQPQDLIGDYIKFEVIKTNIFEPALRVAEYFKPGQQQLPPEPIGGLTGIPSEKEDPSLNHALSEAAYRIASEHKGEHPLTPILEGAVAILTFPVVSPVHLKTAFSILSPQPPHFPAPTRRATPSYYDSPVQDGLKKLLLLGGRIDGQVFDMEGTRWVGSIDGGIDGLRAQLVALLQGFGIGLTSTLESASRNLWFTMESRRKVLEEEAKPKEEEKA